MDTTFVMKLGVLILLFGVATMFLQNKTSYFFNSSNTPFLKTFQISPSPINFQEAHEIPTQENGRTKYAKNERKCDIFVGDWVPYDGEPLYNSSCSFIQDYQNCMLNGRPDKDYLHLRWKPRGCDLPRLDPARFLEFMRNKTWAFVGDSVARNHAQSLVCTLSTVGKAVPVYHDESLRSQTWFFPSYNFTTSVIWSPFLAKDSSPQRTGDYSLPENQLQLDKLRDTWTNHYNNWDYAVFSTGKWFTTKTIYYINNTAVGCHSCHNTNITNLSFGVDSAYRKVLETFLDYVVSSGHKGTTFFRTISPDHFEGGNWYGGGKCGRKAPAKEGEIEQSYADAWILEVQRELVAGAVDRAWKKGVDLRLLDVNGMSLLRIDGHPGPYRLRDKKFEIMNGKVVYDCLHWCLPGPIDTWNDILMNIIVPYD